MVLVVVVGVILILLRNLPLLVLAPAIKGIPVVLGVFQLIIHQVVEVVLVEPAGLIQVLLVLVVSLYQSPEVL